MNYYKLTIVYDGTDYQGWQEQTHKQTIVNTLIQSFKDVFSCDMTIIGASRTDAGVHSLGQTALVKTVLDLDPQRLKELWNKILPGDITIIDLQKTNQSFHPMAKVKEKTYYYDFVLERPLPFGHRQVSYFYWKLDIEKLKKCLKLFEGTHDFRSFCSSDGMRSTIRTINEINLEYISALNCYRITFKAQSFLRYMIRRIVGACLDVASRNTVPIEHLVSVLKECNPNQTLLKAPAKGLTLYKIEYEG